jgi:cysteine desulfuration protein SufE
MSNEKLEEYVKIVSDIKDYGELISWINSLSKDLKVDPTIRNPKHYVYGCQVSTWIKCTHQDNKIFFSFDSDSNVTKGVVKILLDIIDGKTFQEIKKITFYDFRQITARLPTERQKTLQIILNKAHELAHTTGETQ